MLALLLGVGGLKRERDYGTSGFMLALPVSRFRLVSARAFIGIAEVALLAFLPALLIPALSPLEGQVYPWSQAFQFGLLWAAGGAFLFMFGFIASFYLVANIQPLLSPSSQCLDIRSRQICPW